MKYDDAHEYWQFLLASREEIEVEADYADLRSSGELETIWPDYRRALLKTDSLSVAGELEKERASLRTSMRLDEVASQIFGPRHELIERELEYFQHVTNFLNGVRSRDPAVRSKFEKAFKRVRDRSCTDEELRTWLPLLVRVGNRNQGRPKLRTPWETEQDAMIRIRRLMASGYSLIEASKMVATEQGHSQQDYLTERSKTLRRLYKKKMKLRE